MIVGMDFGTTNSGLAAYDGHNVRRLPLDPSNENPHIVRTALYITNEQDVFIGREAINRYFDHNVGRPVKLQKVWVGEVEVIADRVYFIQDAYVWADVMSPGRLFLSFKTNLRDHEYTGTIIGQFFYPLESLVALYLYVSRRRAEQLLGQELREVVLGRPVHFADDAEHDQLAQERLLRGAFQAGYERVYLQREPVAAAYHYASLANQPQNILVFDFGGGTLDITIMRLGDGRRQVLATGGVPIAGDVFDQKLVRAKLPKHFGEGSKYGPKGMPTPKWIYDTFSNWQTILELQTPDNRRILQQIEQTSQRPREIRALRSLVSANYGLQMFDVVERTKRDLSDRFGSMIRLNGPEFDVLELITRREFDNIIRPEFLRIERELDETLNASGLRAEQIDAVIRTGGSAEIPLFQQMLQRKFGPDKIHSVDTFGSVTAGLSIIAHGIQSGEIEARAYTRDDLKRQEVSISRPNVAIVDLTLMKRRLATQEGTVEGEPIVQDKAVIVLTRENRLRVYSWAAFGHVENGHEETTAIPAALTALIAGMDEPLVLLTSRYRFLLTTPRQLQDLHEMKQSLEELHHFGTHEQVFAVNRWKEVKQQERLLLITSLGFARAYPSDIMTTSIEAPVPLTFEQPLPGFPVTVLGASMNETIVMVTDGGRALRFPLAELPIGGLQIMKRPDEEALVAAFTAKPEDEILLITEEGFARRMHVAAVHRAEKPNTPGRVIISRRPLRGAAIVEQAETIYVITEPKLIPIDPDVIPLDDDSTKSHRLLKSQQCDSIHGLLQEA